MLELSLSITDPGDNILGIVSTLDIDVEGLLFAAFDVSIIVEQSEIRWNAHIQLDTGRHAPWREILLGVA